MTSPTTTVLYFTFRCHSKSLFGPFVCFLLWHGSSLLILLCILFYKYHSTDKADLLTAENVNAYLGAKVQMSLRPVCWGGDSTLPISSSCSMTCCMILCPSSICAISLPRNITETVTLSLWPKKVRALLILNSMSCSPVFGRNRISLSFV